MGKKYLLDTNIIIYYSRDDFDGLDLKMINPFKNFKDAELEINKG